MTLLLGKVCAQLSTCLHLWGLCSDVTLIACSLSVLLILYFCSIYLATTWHISCALLVFCSFSCSPNPAILTCFNHLLLPQGLCTWCLHYLKYFFDLFLCTYSLLFYLFSSFNYFYFGLDVTSSEMPCLIDHLRWTVTFQRMRIRLWNSLFP